MELINQYFIEILIIIILFTIIIIYTILKQPMISGEIKKENNIKIKKEPIQKEVISKINKTKKELIKVIKRTKRELQAHGKIEKNDFKIFKGSRILIAEDNIINQKVIAGLLADSGIDIIIVNNGQECLDILKDDTNFTLILMDAHMPIIDGFQTTRNIRKTPEYEHIPIIALSGDTAVDDINNMINVGMEDHLQKPLKMDALYDILYVYTTGNEVNNKKISNNIEFDIYQGLETCGGDKEFYLEILNEFMNNYSRCADKIQALLSDNNSKDADKRLLDMTGLAANIGAEHLYKATLDLKKAIASPDDMEYIYALKTFKRTLKHITELIQNYIKEN